MHKDNEVEIKADLATHDLQRRLKILGYYLGNEAEDGVFGEKTAVALRTFQAMHGLSSDSTLDHTTWTALKDASMQMGDRLLYLHMPHFRGRDVGELQAALSSMGFSCAVDNGFGPETELALLDFQENMSLKPTGILDSESLRTILRLKHAWEGKRGFVLEGRFPVLARSLEVLVSNTVLLCGDTDAMRSLADRIANIARATSVDSRVVSTATCEEKTPDNAVLVILKQGKPELPLTAEKKDCDTNGESSPGAHDLMMIHAEMSQNEGRDLAEPIRNVLAKEGRVTLHIHRNAVGGEDATLQDQIIALLILDMLCNALADTSHTD